MHGARSNLAPNIGSNRIAIGKLPRGFRFGCSIGDDFFDDRGVDDHEAAIGAGNGALHQENIVRSVHALNTQRLNGDALVPHVAGHTFALRDTFVDRVLAAQPTGSAMALGTAVRRGQAVETMALHYALETFAFADPSDIDVLGLFKNTDADFIALLVGRLGRETNFADEALRGRIGFFAVPQHRLGEGSFLLPPLAPLHEAAYRHL